jgi:hypothetical protein
MSLRAGLFGLALAAAGGFANKAMASDPLPGDAIGLPPDVNIGLVYLSYANDDNFTTSNGTKVNTGSQNENFTTIARYVRTFGVDGYTVGVQAVLPYVTFLNKVEVGGASLSKQGGFVQPLLGAFAFPINDDAHGRSVAVGGWIFPPISSFNKNDTVNVSENLTTYEVETGFHQILLGSPTAQNLSLEAWGEGYFYSNNDSFGPGETYREQPTTELRVYLPYVFDPAVGGSVALGFFQSFGGKQTVAIHNTPLVIDTGNRTNESQLRFTGAMFLSPTLQAMVIGEYDVQAHGGFLNRSITLRLAKFF